VGEEKCAKWALFGARACSPAEHVQQNGLRAVLVSCSWAARELKR